jgi:hypothetical protein
MMCWTSSPNPITSLINSFHVIIFCRTVQHIVLYKVKPTEEMGLYKITQNCQQNDNYNEKLQFSVSTNNRPPKLVSSYVEQRICSNKANILRCKTKFISLLFHLIFLNFGLSSFSVPINYTSIYRQVTCFVQSWQCALKP